MPTMTATARRDHMSETKSPTPTAPASTSPAELPEWAAGERWQGDETRVVTRAEFDQFVDTEIRLFAAEVVAQARERHAKTGSSETQAQASRYLAASRETLHAIPVMPCEFRSWCADPDCGRFSSFDGDPVDRVEREHSASWNTSGDPDGDPVIRVHMTETVFSDGRRVTNPPAIRVHDRIDLITDVDAASEFAAAAAEAMAVLAAAVAHRPAALPDASPEVTAAVQAHCAVENEWTASLGESEA
jgi:hypothetical protein